MTYRACGNCFSMDVYPYLGFETGRKYQCKTCGTISPFVVEFETIEALKAFCCEQTAAECIRLVGCELTSLGLLQPQEVVCLSLCLCVCVCVGLCCP